MAISHAFSNAVPDATGTLTIWYGATTATVAATDIVRPSNWNSAHDQFLTVTGNTAGQSTFSGSNIVIGGGPNITISGVNATRFDISAGAGGAGSLNISAGTTSNNLTAVTFANANGLAFGLDGSTVTGSYTVPTVTNSSWTVSDNGTSGTVARLAFTNLNGVTLSLSTGANGSHTIVGSHNALTSQSNQNVTAANGGFAFQTLSFSNANGVSFGTSAGSAITASHNALTTARASNDAIGLNTAQSNVTWTVNSSGLSLDARGYAGTGTTFNGANVSGSMTVNSGGVQLSLSAAAAGGETRLTAYAQSNTTQSSSGTIPLSSLNFAGAGIASVGITNGSVVVSVPAGGGAGDGGVFAGVSTGGNTAGSTGTVSTGNFVLVGSNGITLSQSTAGAGSHATVTILGAAPASRYWQGPVWTLGNAQHGNSLVSVMPFLVQAPYVASDLRFVGSFTVATAANNSSAYVDLSVSAVLYSRNGSTLSSILSGSNSFTVSWSSNAAGGLRLVTGAKAFNLTHAATTMTPGDYWWAVHVSTTNTGTGAATTALGNSISMFVHHTLSNQVGVAKWGADTNLTQGALLGQGIISTGATRASIAFSDMTVTGTRGANAALFFEHRNVTVY